MTFAYETIIVISLYKEGNDGVFARVIPIGRVFGKERVIQDEVTISEGDIVCISSIPPSIFKLDDTNTAVYELSQSVCIATDACV